MIDGNHMMVYVLFSLLYASLFVASEQRDIRLVGGTNLHEGRVEVRLDGEWGTVCDDGWDMEDARVACRQAGFGDPIEATTNANEFGEGSGAIHLDDVRCDGVELSLFECHHRGLRQHNCHHGEDAGVKCVPVSEPNLRQTVAPVRLVGGSSEHEGRVEVFIGGQWGTVCDDLWDLTDASVACGQLGFGPATSTPGSARFGQGSGSILMDDVQCSGSETSLDACPYVSSHNCGHSEDAGVICLPSADAPLRLVGGSSEYEGRVEVFIGGRWGTVCDDLWDLNEASVACRQLGFGPATSAPGSARFGQGSGPILMDNVDCIGVETSLISCEFESSHNCGHSEDAGIICLPPGSSERPESTLRLVGGSSDHEGRVEVFIDGQWGTVCDDQWSVTDASVVCRQLGFGPATSAPGSARFGQGSGPILMDDVQCSGSETSLDACPYVSSHNCGHSEDAGAVCSPQVPLDVPEIPIRLTGGATDREGRVEVFIGGQWGTVCDDIWDMTDANVACRQLGFGPAILATHSAHFGEGSGSILMDNVDCDGDEMSLAACRYYRDHNCAHSEDAGIVCSQRGPADVPEIPIRLIGGSTENEGRVEVFIDGQWGTVCDDIWDMTDANVACRQLGFGPATSAPHNAEFGEGSGPILMDNVDCSGDEMSLVECSYHSDHNCRHSEDAGIACYAEGLNPNQPSIRLVGSSSPYEGRVEVLIAGEWGTVCDDLWDMDDARVACRQLGYGPATDARSSAPYGPGTGPIHLDDLRCVGSESMLISCRHAGNMHNCNHGEDAGLVCLPPEGEDPPTDPGSSIRLVDGPSLYEGRLEVYINGRWGTVCDDLFTLTDANVACSQLGFGRAVSVRSLFYGNGLGPILMDNVDCTGTETSLLSCAYLSDHNCRHEEDVGIMCEPPEGQGDHVRLVGGSAPNEGRVEVLVNGEWGTVCDDLWDMTDSNVVCQQLGFGPALAVKDSSVFGEGSGLIVMDNVNCKGSETSLLLCPHLGNHNCVHREDVGIICQAEVKLYDSNDYSALDWTVYPPQNPDSPIYVGWTEAGASYERIYQTCHVSDPRDSWLRMPYIQRRGANRIHVEVKFTMYSCAGIVDAQLCKETFDVYFYQSDNDDATEISPSWTAPPYQKVARIAEGRFSDPDTQDEEVVNVRIENFGPVTANGFYIAFRDQGACMALLQVRIFYQVTPAPSIECAGLPLIDLPMRASCTNDTSVGSLCTYSCDGGFILQGVSKRKCQVDGRWHPDEQEMPTCEAHVTTMAPLVECSPLDRPNYPLFLSCTNNSREGSLCTYSCAEGFILDGSPERTCLSSGLWDISEAPICQAVTCPPLQIKNGTTTCTNGWEYLSACMLICNPGYELNRHVNLQCTSSGDWNRELPTCIISTCPVLPHLANGVIACTKDNLFGSVCIMACDDGFRLEGPESRECEERETWSEYQPVCQDVRCPTLMSPHFGSLACTQGSKHGSVCTTTCGVGYKAIGSTSTTCNTNGTWTHDTPTCEYITCDTLEAPSNGNVTCFHSRVCMYSCNEGFKLAPVSSTVRTCDANGWSGETPTCIAQRNPIFENCPRDALTFISDPTRDTATVNWPVPTAVAYDNEKLRGMHISGPEPGDSVEEGSYLVLYTVIDRIWNIGTCEFTVIVTVIRCPELSEEGPVRVDCSHGFLRDSVCRFSCSTPGLHVVGAEMTQCVLDGDVATWTSARPSCTDHTAPAFIDCPASVITVADANETSAAVAWTDPQAIDNWDSILRVEQIEGNSSGSVMPEGAMLVTYEAVDQSGNTVQCSFDVIVRVIRCPEPALEDGIIATCSGNTWGSVCNFICPEGHALQGHSMASCQRNGFNGVWSNQPPTCVDNVPPVFTKVPDPIEVLTDPLETSAYVTWELPTIDDEDFNATVVQIAGPGPDQILEEGFFVVQYRAEDSAGNAAHYTFNITVKVIRCFDPEPEENLDVEVICNHGNLRGSTCSYSCPIGYDVIGSLSSTCVMGDDEGEAGSWNASFPSCQARSCPPLPPPSPPTQTACESDLGNATTYGTNCTFMCPLGYQGIGEPITFCQADGTWTDTGFRCQRRQCLGLNSNGIFTTNPHDCMGFPEYGDVCSVSCLLPGYQLDGPGSPDFHCIENGTWNQTLEDFTCLDIEPPELVTCPESFTVTFINPGRGEVIFDPPTAHDNSNGTLRIVTSPENITLPYYITLDTEFSYEFFDGANNSIKCTFNVFVKEEFSVDVTYCPEDKEVETEKEANVSWARPRFLGEDNPLIEITSSVNGTSALLQIGTHSIEYRALNTLTGRESFCRFNITVKPLHCPRLDAPENGALSCRDWPGDVKICSMSCKEGFDIPRLRFAQQPPLLYECHASQGSAREWKPNDNVVDCSEIKGRGPSRLPAGLLYYEGDCTDLITRETIAAALMTKIQASIQDLCDPKECSVTEVTVTCGSTDSSLLGDQPVERRRRSAQEDIVSTLLKQSSMMPQSRLRLTLPGNVTLISFNIKTSLEVDKNMTDDETINDVGELLINMKMNLANILEKIVETGTISGVDGDLIVDDASFVLGDIQSMCDEGYIPQTGSKQKCVACPRGYFSSGDTEVCEICPKGSFQHKAAQSTCELCPDGHSTTTEGSKSIEECKAKCSPGFFSPTGLVPCLPCNLESYQSEAGQRSCDKCSNDGRTSRYGSTSEAECNF